MTRERLSLFDTTLRDGQQTQGVQFSVAEKVQIAKALDALGVDYIEGGWPGANPTDSEFFAAAPKTGAKMTAFGMTKRVGRSADNDDVLAAVLDAGGLVTDEIVIGLIEEKLAQPRPERFGGFIFDGFPRTLKQADALGELMVRKGQSLHAVIEMQVDDAALVARITGRFTCGNCGAVYHDVTKPTKVEGTCDVCGGHDMKRRADDTEQALKTRLMEYYKKTSPLIGYYYAKGNLCAVDGLAEMGAVAADISKVLDRP